MTRYNVAYYNENDPYAAQWLRNLISAGHIAPGYVDERSIEDVRPDELRGYTQCHFFAGIGVWSYALRLAGWPDNRPVWTGSCPCQPFSAAGKRGGITDERHLWPAWFWLIEQCRPRVVFGEQVASKDGLGWLDLVQTDLEAAGYANAAVDLCAAGVGAPHIRQRLWFVADSTTDGRREERKDERGRFEGDRAQRVAAGFVPGGAASGLEHSEHKHERPTRQQPPRSRDTVRASEASEVADAADSAGLLREPRPVERGFSPGHCGGQGHGESGPVNGFWRAADWLLCRDGKWRPVEPGTFPLAHGAPARVGRLRAYGNAIVAPVAAQVISAYMEVWE